MTASRSALAQNQQALALHLLRVGFLIMSVFSGLDLTAHTWTWQAAFFRWASYLSFYRYATNALVRLQYYERQDGCGTTVPSTQVQAMQSQLQQSAHTQQQSAGRAACDAVLSSTDQELGLGLCFGAMIAILVLLHIVAFVALKRHQR